MRVSRAQAEENRRHVIEVAGRLFRERGVDGIGLNDLMAAAGLTRGAFYGQFDSKEALVVEASERALAGNAQRWSAVIAESPEHPFAAVVAFYLSNRHRQAIGNGCALAALAADAARSGAALGPVFEAGVEAHLGILASLQSELPEEEAQDRAIATLATMVGALLLSRAVGGTSLSARILDAAAHDLIARNGDTIPAGQP